MLFALNLKVQWKQIVGNPARHTKLHRVAFRFISHDHAVTLLQLQHPFTARELRAAYFSAAKKCHPDILSATAALHKDATKESNNNKMIDPAERFRLVTEAYEVLQSNAKYENLDWIITQSEEEEYRDACFKYLGQPAEIVEESKRCPNFRQWLMGRTDAAAYWQNFFLMYGGLAPKLRSTLLLTCDNIDVAKSNTVPLERRKRPRR